MINRKQAWPLGAYKTSIYRESGQVANWQDGSHRGPLQRSSERFRTTLCSEDGWAFECSSGSRLCHSRYIISFIFLSSLYLIFFIYPSASPMAQWVKNLPAVQETQEMQVQSLGQEELLEKKMATHSSILAWKIPRTEEPGGLQSMGSQRGGHD